MKLTAKAYIVKANRYIVSSGWYWLVTGPKISEAAGITGLSLTPALHSKEIEKVALDIAESDQGEIPAYVGFIPKNVIQQINALQLSFEEYALVFGNDLNGLEELKEYANPQLLAIVKKNHLKNKRAWSAQEFLYAKSQSSKKTKRLKPVPEEIKQLLMNIPQVKKYASEILGCKRNNGFESLEFVTSASENSNNAESILLVMLGTRPLSLELSLVREYGAHRRYADDVDLSVEDQKKLYDFACSIGFKEDYTAWDESAKYPWDSSEN
jgi:hypothetical protein